MRSRQRLTGEAGWPLLVMGSLLVGRLTEVVTAGRAFLISAVDLTGLGLGGSGAVLAWRRRQVRVDPALLGHVGLLLVVGLQLIGGDDRAAMIGGSSRIVVPALVLFGLSQWWWSPDRTPERLDAARRWWPRVLTGFGVVLAVWVLVLAVGGAADPTNLDFYDFKTDLVMPLGASNYLAAFLLLPAGLAAGMVFEDRRYLFPLAVVLVGLLATLSRGGFLAGAIAVVALAVVRLRPTAARWIVVVLVLVAMLTVVVAITGYDATGQSTVDGRLRLWAGAWDGFAATPLLGVGYNDLLDITATLEQQHPNAHNLVLHSLATTGVLGGAAYLWIWATLTARLLAAPASPHRDGLFVAAVALFAHAQVEALSSTRAVEVVLAVLLAAAGTLGGTGWSRMRTLALQRDG